MKISYNWLKEYTGLEIPPLELSEILTNCGLEVEAMEHKFFDKSRLQGVVVGYVVEKAKHPDADKLSLTKVDIGNGNLLSIVCGAPNVEAGQKVLVATIGTKLNTPKGELVIRKTKIRGMESEGMICAEDELGLGESHEGIMVLDENAPVGLPAADYIQTEEDYIFEIGLTPNRSDAASHIGIARDVLAVYNCRHQTRNKVLFPDVADFKEDNHSLNIEIVVEDTAACPRYTGVTISNVEVKDSPDWLQKKLKAVGLRPINNVVDITNFVLIETGQPLHAFDADKIEGKKVIVKKLPNGTKFITLDGDEKILTDEDLMICNENEGMCIAGVFGGQKSGVTAETKNIFLESAYFSPQGIRKTSKRHGLKTDASFRFERGADPNMTVYALKRAAMLIKNIAGGQISSAIVDVYPNPIENFTITFSLNNLNAIAGQDIPEDAVKNILASLSIEIIEQKDDILILSVPPFKTDVTRDVDVVEEILRIYGYNNIEINESLRSCLSYSKQPDPEKLQNVISDYLTSCGFYEIITNSLTKADYYYQNNKIFNVEQLVHILNPLSKELNVMRQTLLFSGLECILFNKNHKNLNNLFYEFGKVYFHKNPKAKSVTEKYHEEKHLAVFASGNIADANWHRQEMPADIYFLKAMVDNIIRRLSIDVSAFTISEQYSSELFTEGLTYKHNGKIVCDFGMLQNNILKQFDIKDAVFYAELNWDYLVYSIEKKKIQYKEVSRFPEVKRDLALLIDKSVKYEEIERIAYETEPYLLKRVELFDIYEGSNIGEDKKSYAVSYVLQDEEKTLTEQRIEETMNKLIEAYKNKLHATLR